MMRNDPMDDKLTLYRQQVKTFSFIFFTQINNKRMNFLSSWFATQICT